MTLKERVTILEQQVASLDAELAQHRRLGPRPESHTPDPKIVKNLVAAARKAIRDSHATSE